MAATFAGELTAAIQATVQGAPNAEAFAAGPSVAGCLPDPVAAANFTTAADVVFYPNESMIVATVSETTIAGARSTIIALPDGSVMTLVGVAADSPVLFEA